VHKTINVKQNISHTRTHSYKCGYLYCMHIYIFFGFIPKAFGPGLE